MAEPSIEEIEGASEAVTESNERMAEANKKAKELNVSFTNLSKSNVDLIKEFGKLTQESESVAKGMLNVVGAVTKTFVTFEGLANLFNNMGNSILADSQKLANAYEQSRADFVKLSGDTTTSTSNISKAMMEASQNIDIFGVNTAKATMAVNVGVPQISEAYINATQGVNAFGAAQRENLVYVSTTTAQLEQLGISAQTTAQNTRLLSESMGLTATDTKLASDEVARTTLALTGMNGSLTESAQLIEKNTDLILIFGTDALLNLQGQATATGIALDTLTQVSAKFNTFETAADQVGKLNALLGADYLSVTEMMYAEPADQVQMISQAFQDAGVSVENMDPIQKKFMLTTIQSTLGLKNQAEAQRFLNADDFERGRLLAENQKKEEARADVQAKLNELLVNSKPALEQLINALSMMMATLTPLFVKLNEITTAIAKFSLEIKHLFDEYPLFAYFATGVIIALGTLFSVLSALVGIIPFLLSLLAPLLTLFGSLASVAAPTTAGLTTLSAGILELAAATAAFAAALFLVTLQIAAVLALVVALVGAFAAVGFAVAAIIYSFAQLIDSIHNSGTGLGEFAIAIVALMVGFLLFQGVLLVAIPIMSIFGSVLIGVGIAFAAASIGAFAFAAGIVAIAAAMSLLSIVMDPFIKLFTPLLNMFSSMGQTFVGLFQASSIEQLTSVITKLIDISSLIDEISSKKLIIDVEFSNPTGFAALAFISDKLVPAAASTPATTMAERTSISINQIIVKFDDNTAFKSKVQEIIFNDGSTFKNKVNEVTART